MVESHYDDPVYAKYKDVLKGAQRDKVVTRFPPSPRPLATCTSATSRPPCSTTTMRRCTQDT